jgi:hypothetical protein
MKKRFPLNYRTNMISYTNDVLNKKNFFSAFAEYFVLFFDFSGVDKNSFYSMELRLKKNRLLGNFVRIKRFLTKTLSFLPSKSRDDFVMLRVNDLLLSNDVGFIGLLLVNQEDFFLKLSTIFFFCEFCFLQKFTNPFGKNYLANSTLELDFFFKPLFVKLSNFLICPKFFGYFIWTFRTLGGFGLKLLQISKLLIVSRLFYFFFNFFFRGFLQLLRLQKNGYIKSIS